MVLHVCLTDQIKTTLLVGAIDALNRRNAGLRDMRPTSTAEKVA